MQLSRIDRVYGHIDVTAKLPDGEPAVVAGVDVALLHPRTTPTTATTWVPASYVDGEARVLLAGPDADPTGAQQVPAGGADMWLRIADNPEVQAVKVARIDVA